MIPAVLFAGEAGGVCTLSSVLVGMSAGGAGKDGIVSFVEVVDVRAFFARGAILIAFVCRDSPDDLIRVTCCEIKCAGICVFG